MSDEAQIGRRIRRIRQAQGLTLQDVADRTGLTKGYLSKVENTEKAPPVSTLLSIARALGTGIAVLFGENEVNQRLALVRAGERPTVARDPSVFGYTYEALAHTKTTKRMEPYVLTLPAETVSETAFQHPGEEILFVLEGRMGFRYGEEYFELEPGDTIYFEGEVPHYGKALGGGAKCLVVICPR